MNETTFVEIDHDNHVRVVAVVGDERHHVVVDDLGSLGDSSFCRRAATKILTSAGWTTRGAWRTAADGADIRTVTRR